MIDFKKISLEKFLNHKTMYYDKIDFTIIKKAWNELSSKIKLPFVIHIVGTNGKGTTGRFLAHCLHKINKSVLHYSSPHINKFNERIWIEGSDISDEELTKAHLNLQKILSLELLEKLSYFEYTTLLALFYSNNKDYLVLEAGLGGEFDATNVIKNDISLITTIGLDHQDFLGDTIKDIAMTKMRACDKKMLLGHQVEKEVIKYAKSFKDIEFKNIKEHKFSYNKENLPYTSYLLKNLDLAIFALNELGLEFKEEYLKDLKFFGRFEEISSNIIIDVGHNPLAAGVLKKELQKKDKKVILIYNSFSNKDYEEVLKILKPVVKLVYIIDISDNRVVKTENLTKVCEKLNIISVDFKEQNLSKNEDYLVFGSFLVVEEFLKIIGKNEK